MTIEELQIELQKNPRSPLFTRLADYYLNENMLNEAFELLEKGLKYNPTSVSGHLLIAKVYKLRSDWNKALEHLNYSHQKAPTNWQVLLIRADLYLKINQPRKALDDFKKVLFYNPTQNMARKAVAKLELLTADDYEEELFEMRSLRDLEPKSPEIFKNPALQKVSSVPETVSVPQLQHLPAQAERILSLIDAFTLRKDYQKALQLLKECHQEFGHHPEIQTRLLRLSQFEDAEKIRPKSEIKKSHARHQLVIEKKKKALELLLRRIQEIR